MGELVPHNDSFENEIGVIQALDQVFSDHGALLHYICRDISG
jgi:hypothetical protein